MNYNELNKTIFEGIDSLPEVDESGIINITNVTNNRVVIILKKGEDFKGKINAPKGTNIMFITKDETRKKPISDIRYNKDSEIISRTYGLNDVRIESAYDSYNKKIAGSATNNHTSNNARNNQVFLNGFNYSTGNNASNLNIGGNAKNVDTQGNAVNRGAKNGINIYTKGQSENIGISFKSSNYQTNGNATSINIAGNSDHQDIGGDSVYENIGLKIKDSGVNGDTIIDGKKKGKLLEYIKRKLQL